jgi:hypothetical protein
VSERKDTIKKNLQFILSHFNGQEFIFPRAITTLESKGQRYPKNEEEALQHFLEADFKECKINGYPYFDKDHGDNVSPSFLFIEMDLSLCNTCQYPKRKLDYLLKQTLNKIEKEIHGIPTVLWTGNSYHICLPIKLSTSNHKDNSPFDLVTMSKNYKSYTDDDLATEFMRFSATYFTTNNHQQKDLNQNNNNNISIKSCFITVPETTNIKNNHIVEVIQKWDGKVSNANTIASHFLDKIMQKRQEHAIN